MVFYCKVVKSNTFQAPVLDISGSLCDMFEISHNVKSIVADRNPQLLATLLMADGNYF